MRDTNYPDFITECATAITGCDDPATAAWLHVALADDRNAKLAVAHWGAADEPTRLALAACLGFCEPTGERPPVPQGIYDSYTRCFDRAAMELGEPE